MAILNLNRVNSFMFNDETSKSWNFGMLPILRYITPVVKKNIQAASARHFRQLLDLPRTKCIFELHL